MSNASFLEIRQHENLYSAVKQWLDHLFSTITWEYRFGKPLGFYCFAGTTLIIWYNTRRNELQVRPSFTNKINDLFYIYLSETGMSETELIDDVLALIVLRFEINVRVRDYFQYNGIDVNRKEVSFQTMERMVWIK